MFPERRAWKFARICTQGSIKIFKSVRSAQKLSQHFQDHILPDHSLLSRKGSNHTNTQEEVRANACKDFENDPVTSILWKNIIEEVKIHTSPVECNLSTSARCQTLRGTGYAFEFSSLVLDMTILIKVCTVLAATRLLYHYIEIHGHP